MHNKHLVLKIINMTIEIIIKELEERYYLIPKQKKPLNHTSEFVDLIAKFVCDYKEIDVDTLKLKSHKREYSDLRRVIWYLVRKLSDKKISQNVMANYFNRDHATALTGIVVCENLMKINNRFKMDVENIERALISYLPKFT